MVDGVGRRRHRDLPGMAQRDPGRRQRLPGGPRGRRAGGGHPVGLVGGRPEVAPLGRDLFRSRWRRSAQLWSVHRDLRLSGCHPLRRAPRGVPAVGRLDGRDERFRSVPVALRRRLHDVEHHRQQHWVSERRRRPDADGSGTGGELRRDHLLWARHPALGCDARREFRAVRRPLLPLRAGVRAQPAEPAGRTAGPVGIGRRCGRPVRARAIQQ